jgi:hypothetical protein
MHVHHSLTCQSFETECCSPRLRLSSGLPFLRSSGKFPEMHSPYATYETKDQPRSRPTIAQVLASHSIIILLRTSSVKGAWQESSG